MATSDVSVTTAVEKATAAHVQQRMPFGRWFRELGWRHVVGLLAVVFALYPVAYTVAAAFNQVDNLSAARLIPAKVTLDNFRELFNNPLTPIPTWLWNSLKIATIAAGLTTLLSSMAAYAFGRLRWKGRRVGLLTILLIQVFPQQLAFVAVFLLIQSLGGVWSGIGLNTHLAMIMIYMGGAVGFNTWLIKGYMDSIPFDLDESAKVDGASQAQTFVRILIPLMRPVLAVIFFVTFMAIYGEYILASFILQDLHQKTLPVGLQLFVQSEYAAKWGNLGASAVLGALPVVLVFFPLQKQLISGLTGGAVKG